MVSANELVVNFGERYLFNKISFIITQKDRIGLTGKNGAGKSTLLKIIAKELEPDGGNIVYPTDFSIGYLPQDMDFVSGKTVIEEVKTAFKESQELQNKIEEINNEISVRTDYESEGYMELLTHLHDYNERLNLIGGGNVEIEAEKVLKGLGFLSKDFSRQTDEFSGGWRMRIELAKLLLSNANLLLLDEPTNHLDIESIQWLEDFLLSYKGAVVLISHDRAFLDAITKRTIEISLGKIYDYKAAYTKYLEMRAERRENQIAAYNNQQKEIQDIERFIERFRAKASKAVQVQSRVKQLNRINRIEIEQEDNATMGFKFPPAPRSGKVALEADNAGKSYGDKKVFDDVSFFIERGKKVAFVGKNGEGKSTMSKIIVGEIPPSSGEIKIGHNVNIAYFAQNQSATLDKEKTIFETIDEAAHGEIRKKIRGLLGSFLFSEEDIDKKIKVLSGGERARVAFCKLLLTPCNLLVLDEPTNHLDIRSKEVLKEALKKYDGTFIIISHDRDFLDGLTEEMYEFTNGKVKPFYGGVYEFLTLKKEALEKATPTPVITQSQKKEKNSYQNQKSLDKKIKTLKNKINNLEKEIEQQEIEIEKLSVSLSSPDSYDDKLVAQYDQLKKDVKNNMASWEENNKELELIID